MLDLPKSHWTFENEPFIEEDPRIQHNDGFVYVIKPKKIYEDEVKGWYLGKKFFKCRKTFQRNNRKIRRKVESNWPVYTGSSKDFNEYLKEVGKDKFDYKILLLGKKSVVNYFEVCFQFMLGVLYDDNCFCKNINGLWRYNEDVAKKYEEIRKSLDIQIKTI
jgi:hypothetical protein